MRKQRAASPVRFTGLMPDPHIGEDAPHPPSWTLRILSSMSEGVCEWLIQRDREFLNVWASCGQ